MSDAEITIAIDSIRTTLEERSLQWLSREIDDTLRLGKPALRQIVANVEQDADLVYMSEYGMRSGSPRTRRTTVPTTEQYSRREELQLLLDAIIRTVVATQEMEGQVLRKISERMKIIDANPRIQFEREGATSPNLQPYSREIEMQIDQLKATIKLLRVE